MTVSADPDTMYFHQAVKEPDAKDFKEAVMKEFSTMLQKGIFRFVQRATVPEGMTLFPSVWAMKRKCRVMSREIYKWKARLNLDGSKQVAGIDHDETFAPIAQWEVIRLVLTMILKIKWRKNS